MRSIKTEIRNLIKDAYDLGSTWADFDAIDNPEKVQREARKEVRGFLKKVNGLFEKLESRHREEIKAAIDHFANRMTENAKYSKDSKSGIFTVDPHALKVIIKIERQELYLKYKLESKGEKLEEVQP